jgi:predicted nucleotidyltransferase
MSKKINPGNPFTPYPEANSILQELLKRVQAILGDHLVGFYLEGSLALGDFDQDSDIDFVAVTDEEVSPELFSELSQMHEQLAKLKSPLAKQLEGSYISRSALRRHDPLQADHPNLERGRFEHLKMDRHDETWMVHRHILREHGIAIAGPDPQTLIDPVSPNDLRQVMISAITNWAAPFLEHPEGIFQQGYQSYIVLTLCRILYTLEFGDIVSKHKAASWVQSSIGAKWSALIDRAWIGRHKPQVPVNKDELQLTLELIRIVQKYGQRYSNTDINHAGQLSRGDS